MKTIQEAKKHAMELSMQTSELTKMRQAMDEMIQMDWKDKPDIEKNPNIKLTVSPQARNTFLGAKRLMTAVSPIIKIPRERNAAGQVEYYDKFENFCKAVWDLSGHFAQRPLHFDVVDQLLRYDEFQLAIVDTDQLKKLHENGNKAEKYRYERISETTPFLFQSLDVKSGFWESDAYGLIDYFHTTELTIGKAVSMFGEKAIKDSKLDPTSINAKVYYCDYWDLDVHFAWLASSPLTVGSGEILIGKEDNGKHNLPVIPIVCQVGEASQHEAVKEHTRQPLLYGIEKSKLWQRMNMLETYKFTNIHTLSMFPAFKHTRGLGNEDTDVELDVSGPVSITHLAAGDDLQPLMREAVNMDMEKGLMEARQVWGESSIYPQTFGEPLGGQQAFSTVALLSQSGRLPLVTYQLCGGFGIARAFENMFALIRDSGGSRKARWLNQDIDINPKEIPINLLIDVRLDADLPVNQLDKATIAMNMKNTDMLTRRWILENVMNINDASQMDDERFEEKFQDKMMDESLFNKMREDIKLQVQQEQQQKMQQMMQQRAEQEAAAQQGQQGPPQGMPPGMPEEGMPQGMPEQGPPE